MHDILVVGGIFREILDGDTRPRLRYGGSGLSAAVAAARLGTHVVLASYVGADDEDAVRSELGMAGIDDSLVTTLPGASGTFVFPTQQNSDRPWPMYRPAESVPVAPARMSIDASIVVIFGIPDFDPISAGWLAGLQSQITLMWDRQGWLSRSRDARSAAVLAPHRKIYLANEQETIEETGTRSLDEALQKLPPSGFCAALIKRGTDGVVVVENEDQAPAFAIVPAFPVTCTSTIGSGDVFAGAVAAKILRGHSLLTAAEWGCAAAAVALTCGTNLLPEDAQNRIEELINSRSSQPRRA